MPALHVAALTLQLRLPGCDSLKEKRSRLKPLLHELRREFHVAAAELEANDSHQHAVVAMVTIGNDAGHVARWLAGIPGWIERRRPDLEVVDHRLEHL
jgi:hypothetical protein